MKPRHDPCYDQTDYPNEKFVGYIEEFDLYITPHDYDDPSEPARFPLTLVGEERGPVDDREYNFDTYAIEGGIIMPHSDTLTTLNVTPYHMCLIYAAAREHGLIKEQEDGA